jgi:hypothetical protein
VAVRPVGLLLQRQVVSAFESCALAGLTALSRVLSAVAVSKSVPV